jgi:hypothetical protein
MAIERISDPKPGIVAWFANGARGAREVRQSQLRRRRRALGRDHRCRASCDTLAVARRAPFSIRIARRRRHGQLHNLVRGAQLLIGQLGEIVGADQMLVVLRRLAVAPIQNLSTGHHPQISRFVLVTKNLHQAFDHFGAVALGELLDLSGGFIERPFWPTSPSLSWRKNLRVRHGRQ